MAARILLGRICRCSVWRGSDQRLCEVLPVIQERNKRLKALADNVLERAENWQEASFELGAVKVKSDLGRIVARRRAMFKTALAALLAAAKDVTK